MDKYRGMDKYKGPKVCVLCCVLCVHMHDSNGKGGVCTSCCTCMHKYAIPSVVLEQLLYERRVLYCCRWFCNWDTVWCRGPVYDEMAETARSYF